MTVSELIYMKGEKPLVGKADEIAAMITSDPSLFPELFDFIFDPDRTIRIRTGCVIERIYKIRPHILIDNKALFFDSMEYFAKYKEVFWYLPVILGNLDLTADEAADAFSLFRKGYDEYDNKFWKVFFMQGMTDLALRQDAFRAEVEGLLEESMHSGSAALKVRAKKLIRLLNKQS